MGFVKVFIGVEAWLGLAQGLEEVADEDGVAEYRHDVVLLLRLAFYTSTGVVLTLCAVG